MKAVHLLWLIPIAGFGGCAWILRWPHTEAGKAFKAQQVAQVEADKLPRKTSEANGCEVWAFKPADRWLYFARCGNRTETVNTWKTCRQVQSGKTTRTECTDHSMPITQETQ